jgi:threonine dehydrogenase-like Zn-dependent dehydrogenase
MARELIAPAPNQVAWREVPNIALESHQIRVRSLYAAAKHGTELSLYTGSAAARGSYDNIWKAFRSERTGSSFPVRLGNTVVGEVIEVGSAVSRLGVGDQVFAYAPFCDELVWPDTVRKLPPGVPWQAAACLDPADFAIGAIRDGKVRLGDAVVVFSLGAIGLMAIQAARLAGAYPVIGVDPLATRRQIALELGVDHVLDAGAVDVGLAVKELTGGRGADVCIEYSGKASALQAALRGVAYLGTIVAGAWPSPYPAGLDFGAEAHMNRPTIVFSRACSEPNPDYPNWSEERLFEVAWRLLASGAIQSVPVVSPIVDFDDLLDAYPRIATQPQDYLKLGVRFPAAG